MFLVQLSGFDKLVFDHLSAVKKRWIIIFNNWFMFGVVLAALSSAYLMAFTTGSIMLSGVTGLVVLALFISVQAALISIPGFDCEMSEDEIERRMIVPVVRSILIFIMALCFSFPTLLSVQHLMTQQELSAPQVELKNETVTLQVQNHAVTNEMLGSDHAPISTLEYELDLGQSSYTFLLLSVPELINHFPRFYKGFGDVILTILLIACMITLPFVLRDFFLLKEYEKGIYQLNRSIVNNMYGHLEKNVGSNEVILSSLQHPFERRLTRDEVAESKEEKLTETEKADFIGDFFEPV